MNAFLFRLKPGIDHDGIEAFVQAFPELKDHPELLEEILQTENRIAYFEGRILTLKKGADDLGLRLKQIMAAAPGAPR